MTTHRLILMRHAKSDWGTDAREDFDRPLAKRGKQAAPVMAEWLHSEDLLPDRLVSSPALRARATAERVAAKLGVRVERIILEPAIYEADVAALQEVIDRRARGINTLMLVGHNPGLDELLRYLASEPPQPDKKGRLLTTAAVAVLDFAGNGICTKPGSGRLVKICRPRELQQQR